MSPMTRDEYYARYGHLITQQSERLFVDDFLWPLLGAHLEHVIPQRPFIDSTGRSRRIDFSYVAGHTKLAIEVNGETYHAEGIIPNEQFDDNLFRQNEILRDGFELTRFSYNMLQAPAWRPIVMESLRELFVTHAPELLNDTPFAPNPLQREALQALDFYRARGWRKGIVVLPTGTGKTILSALDAKHVGGRTLFVVHRLDILKQTLEAYKRVWPDMRPGILTGEVQENEDDCDVLFASKDTLRQPEHLRRFAQNAFDYMVVDEVHHGQTPSYASIIAHFQPRFALGMTATPDRTDRKDIFELFDYNKVFEVSLQEAIEDGYLVPYTYCGLLDNVDYSRIRYQNNRYRVDDLERHLIIPERNEAILREYLARGQGDKAIGFCVSIEHARRMAEFFNSHGVPAAAITSAAEDRDYLVARFRKNEITVAFTVDLFNEGVDFPNVRVLMFLRPTESKTVFVQQLGRGLRLCVGKDRVTVLDFIGNYRRANQVRKWLAKSVQVTSANVDGRRTKKVVYEYSTGCEVLFDAAVEEILDRQDEQELDITRDDLKEAYFLLAETLGRKPARSDLDATGQYPASIYTRMFGSWRRFLQEIGEYTEASYHYPQGVHLGHILAILKYFGGSDRAGTPFDDRYLRLRGGFDDGRLGAYQRQIKYKLLAAMELEILADDRRVSANDAYVPRLTATGEQLNAVLSPFLDTLPLAFPAGPEGVPSTRMVMEDQEYTREVAAFLSRDGDARQLFTRIFLKMPAVQQMLSFLYQVGRQRTVSRSDIYSSFFHAPFVQQFCDQEGIEEATEEASRRRCPFLLHILAACGLVELDSRDVTVTKFLIAAPIVRAHRRENIDEAERRAKLLSVAWPDDESRLDAADVSMLRELFGRDFLSPKYYLKSAEYVALY